MIRRYQPDDDDAIIAVWLAASRIAQPTKPRSRHAAHRDTSGRIEEFPYTEARRISGGPRRYTLPPLP